MSSRTTGLALCSLLMLSMGCRATGPECTLGTASRDRSTSETRDEARLSAEPAAVDTVAAKYAEWAAAHPPAVDSHVTTTALRQHAFAYCKAILTEEIATVSPSQ